MTDRNLMPIGRFSKCCRLSIKALRHYDEQGLLKPAHVDPHSGYRYYAVDQARDAVLIGMLRSMGISLGTVGELLRSEGTALRNILQREQARITAELEKGRQALRSVERLAREGRLMPYDIAVREEPAYTVAMKSCVTTPERMIDESGALVYELIAELEAAGRRLRDPVMCINDDPDQEERIVVHACIGVSKPWPTLEHARVEEIAGGPVVWLLHRGAYEELGLAYHALFAWAQEHGHEQRAAMREIYCNDPSEVASENLETEVMLPIAG